MGPCWSPVPVLWDKGQPLAGSALQLFLSLIPIGENPAQAAPFPPSMGLTSRQRLGADEALPGRPSGLGTDTH